MNIVRTAGLFCAILAAAALPPVGAQEPDKAKAGSKVVLRIAREFLVKLTRKQFEQDEPIHTSAMGATVDGSAHVAASGTVKLHRSDTESDFDVLVSGDVTTQTVVTRRPVRIVMHGASPFQASRRVVFDGKTFAAQPVAVGVCYHSGVDAIGTLRGGLAAPLIRRLARPIVMRSLPEGDQTADQDIRAQIGTSIAQDTDKIVEVLNEIVALREHAAEELRKQGIKLQHPQVALAATDDYLVAGLGFPQGQHPKLPPAEAPVEIWVYHKLTVLQSELIELVLKKEWARIKPRVQELIARHSPELAGLMDDVQERLTLHPLPGEPDWHVLRFSKKIHGPEPKTQ